MGQYDHTLTLLECPKQIRKLMLLQSIDKQYNTHQWDIVILIQDT